jgi:hypothetical protein
MLKDGWIGPKYTCAHHQRCLCRSAAPQLRPKTAISPLTRDTDSDGMVKNHKGKYLHNALGARESPILPGTHKPSS